MPYWAELWPSGLALATRARARSPRDGACWSSGCGLALPSLAAALAGAERSRPTGRPRRWRSCGRMRRRTGSACRPRCSTGSTASLRPRRSTSSSPPTSSTRRETPCPCSPRSTRAAAAGGTVSRRSRPPPRAPLSSSRPLSAAGRSTRRPTVGRASFRRRRPSGRGDSFDATAEPGGRLKPCRHPAGFSPSPRHPDRRGYAVRTARLSTIAAQHGRVRRDRGEGGVGAARRLLRQPRAPRRRRAAPRTRRRRARRRRSGTRARAPRRTPATALLGRRHAGDAEPEPDRGGEQPPCLEPVQLGEVVVGARDVEVLAADHPERRLGELARGPSSGSSARAGTPPRAARRRRGARRPRRTPHGRSAGLGARRRRRAPAGRRGRARTRGRARAPRPPAAQPPARPRPPRPSRGR